MPGQVRMVNQSQPRPIGQTTITRHTAPVRIQGPGQQHQQQQQQRLINATVRPGGGTTIVQNNIHHQMNPPALQPVGGFTAGSTTVSV